MTLLEAPAHHRPTAHPAAPAAAPAVTPEPSPPRGRPGVVMELATLADPVRVARRISAAVNNTRLSLSELTVAGVPAYPVAGSLAADGPVVARFSVRDLATVVDTLVVEELQALVATVAPVVRARVDR